MSTFSTRLREEIHAVLPPTIFFLVTFHLVSIVHSLMLRGTGIELWTHIQVTVAALILGKAVLIADHLSIINRYPHKPLIYNVVWKTMIYIALATLIHFTERIVEYTRAAGSVAVGSERAWNEVVWPHFFAIQIMLLALIIAYNVMHELVRVIGRDEVIEMFFGHTAG